MSELTDKDLDHICQVRLTWNDDEDYRILGRAVDEVKALRTRVAELTKERDEWKNMWHELRRS